jgi:3-phenylpropionate/trans-cinnamate dioxygenase ferredoxin subunit
MQVAAKKKKGEQKKFFHADIKKVNKKMEIEKEWPKNQAIHITMQKEPVQFGNSKEEVYEALPERKIKKLQAGTSRIALLRIGDKVHAFDVHCPHKGADLGQANINGAGEIICPLHQYRFDLKTGDVRAGYCPALPVYRNELNENGLWIYLP